ncbi:MAG: T9SS type A sorting domain-containing protein [Bacteroidetes bacterium]|nr:T9SS type A sorting domain-containing protein [Bacteroidota bacterium]
MKKMLFLLAASLCAFMGHAQVYAYFNSPNNETVYYSAIMPADSGLFFGMNKANNNSSIYWLQNNTLTEIKSVSGATNYAATFPDNIGGYKQWYTSGNKALFVVNDPSPYKNTLWVTDGTTGGTDSLFSSGDYNTKFYMGGMIGTDFYFTVTFLSPKKTLLYKTDFTKAGTVLVKTINNTNLFWPYTDNNTLYLHGYVGSSAQYDVLYKFTTDTTRLLLGYAYGNARVINGDLYYGISSVLNKKNLTTNVVTVLNNSFNFSTNQILGMFKNKLYVVGANTTAGTQQNLYTSNGTFNSLALLAPNTVVASIPSLYFNSVFGSNMAYFIGKNQAAHYALYATDGSSAGTHQVQDLQSTGQSGLSTATVMRMCGDRAYFYGNNYTIGNTYYSNATLSTCDTSAGSLSILSLGGTGSTIRNIEYFKNKLIFNGYDPAGGYMTSLRAINTCDSYLPLVTGVQELGHPQGFNAYPNPGTGQLFLDLDDPAVNTVLNIYNTVGENVYTQKLVTGHNALNLDLPAGVYVLYLRDEQGQVHTGRIVIQHR